MRRTAIVAALATAGAIAVWIAFQAPVSTSIVGARARHSEPSVDESPVVAPSERATDATRQGAAADTNVPQTSARAEVQASTSIAAGSPVQQRTDHAVSERVSADPPSEGSSSGTDDAPLTTPATESPLSAQEVHDIFVSGDACLVLGGDAKGKERCNRAATLAQNIVTVPKRSADSWAYGMEYELKRRLTELPARCRRSASAATKSSAMQCCRLPGLRRRPRQLAL